MSITLHNPLLAEERKSSRFAPSSTLPTSYAFFGLHGAKADPSMVGNLLQHRYTPATPIGSDDEESLSSTSSISDERATVRQWSTASFTTLPHSTTKIPPAFPQQRDPTTQQRGIPVALAGTCYCLSSVIMVLVNKFALEAFPFASPTMLLFIQCGLCALIVALGQSIGVLQQQTISVGVILTWLPGNCIFVGMLLTSFVALQHLSVPMVTLLKSMANVFTIAGDYMFFGRRYNHGVWLALLLMTLSTVAGGLTDLEFNLEGYIWQLVNCVLTAAYSLYIKRAIHAAERHMPKKQPLAQSSMVLLNNVLSLPMLMGVLFFTGELQHMPRHASALSSMPYALTAGMSGMVSLAVSYCSLWFLAEATPTAYSLVGNLNKIPTALGSYLLFRDTNLTAPYNVASVGLGILGGVIFVLAKGATSSLPNSLTSKSADPMLKTKNKNQVGGGSGAHKYQAPCAHHMPAHHMSDSVFESNKPTMYAQPITTNVQLMRQESFVGHQRKPNPFRNVFEGGNPGWLGGVSGEAPVVLQIAPRPPSGHGLEVHNMRLP